MAGPECSQWLASLVDWQRGYSESGVDIFWLFHTEGTGRGIALTMLVSLQKGVAVSPAAGTA